MVLDKIDCNLGDDMSQLLKLKSVYELLDESFFIPSYQRGYRWTKQQVEDLLDDIWDFDQNVKLDKVNCFYCLQPIVVKKSKNSIYKWDVIDGQQRLTTLFIILKTAQKLLDAYELGIYKIGYETRVDSEEYLQKYLSNFDNSNIDFFHMHKAYETIVNWFSAKKDVKRDFIDRLLKKPILDNDLDIEKNIRVIWYEVEDNNNKLRHDIDIFTRINMGKIPLTNAELVKALLLEGFKTKEKQFEIASEWDQIEYSLQNNDFWLFINKEKKEQPTRIEFIFELIAEEYLTQQNDQFKNTLNKEIDSFYIYHIINHLLNNDTRNNNQKEKETIYEHFWKQVKKQFRILTEWYEDREFFHKIGFLIIYGKKDKKILSISDLIKEYIKVDGTKKDFKDFLDNKIKEQFKDIEISSLNYDDEKDKVKIKKVLLLFNIQTIIDNKKSNMRFQFDRFKNEDWDIEHIRSQTDNYPNKKDEKVAWFLDIELKTDKTIEEVTNMNDDEFIIFYKNMYNEFEGKDSNFKKHLIGNLALLDATTNRGYGNAFFPIKRKTIIENDMNGTFIPICTKNVFMKYYTKDVKDIDHWNKKDAEEYEIQIKKTLNVYLKNEVELNEQ
jgi:uncharacterized protein with ParB-like and HNH nuclease domain